MIAEWMLYCVAVGVLLSAGAAALERGARALRLPTRWPWAAAMALTLALPLAARLLAAPPAAAPAVRMTLGNGAAPARAPAAASAPRRALPLDMAALEAPLRAAWLGSSAAVAAALAALSLVLARRRRRWPHAVVDGVPVLVSRDVGPAVVGLVRSHIVLPRWAAEGDATARRMVLEHEQEHLRAGDPRLLAAALAAVALAPWNPAAWWQLRRLRLAMEVDCDARVLRRSVDVRAYGAALLEAGRRASRSRLALAAVSEPASSLERRIRIMTEPRSRRPLLAASACAAVAAALLAAACEAPQPTAPSPSAPRTFTFERQAAPPADELTLVDARAAVQRYFPSVIAEGMPANDKLLFVLDASGEIIAHEWLRGPADGIHVTTNEPDRRLDAVMERYRSPVNRVAAFKTKPGEIAPTPVQVMLVQLGAGNAQAVLPSTRRIPAGEPVADGPIRTTYRGSAEDRPMHEAVMRGLTAAREKGIVGRVELRITVDAAGKVQRVEATNPGTDARLVDAVRAELVKVTLPPHPAVKTITVWSGEETFDRTAARRQR